MVTPLRKGESMTKHKALTLKQAIAAEKEMRRLEADPKVTKRELRLYMQSSMPCGHAVGNLLTCDRPPNGCVMCLTARVMYRPKIPLLPDREYLIPHERYYQDANGQADGC
jgi:hypothetical protein